MAIRNINKSLAGMEDLLAGVGSETQVRGSASYVIGMIDVPYAVNSVVELQAVDVTKFSRARIYSSATEFADYLFDAADNTGIIPAEGVGTWILVSVSSDTSANLALLASLANTINKYVGKQEWDSTANRPVWAVGPLAADVWVYSDGTTAQTPV